MIATPEDVRAAAARKSDHLIERLVSGDVRDIFPLRLRLRPKRVGELTIDQYAKAVQKLKVGSKAGRGDGYTVHLERRRSNELGAQDFPSHITVDSLDDFIDLTGCKNRVDRTRAVCEAVRHSFPQLESWLLANAKRLDRYADVIDDLIAVAETLLSRPMPDCYLRQLNVRADAKFIQANESTLRIWLDTLLPPSAIRVGEQKFARRYGLRDGEPHKLIRFLDPAVQQRTGFPCDELSLPLRTLAALPLAGARVFIAENRTNLLTLPSGISHSGTAGGIALGGVGDAVTRLRDLTWLEQCEIWYWGDLDVDGFRILANLRRIFPRTNSLFMDEDTLQAHHQLAVAGNGKRSPPLPNLTDEENAVLTRLSGNRSRPGVRNQATAAVAWLAEGSSDGAGWPANRASIAAIRY